MKFIVYSPMQHSQYELIEISSYDTDSSIDSQNQQLMISGIEENLMTEDSFYNPIVFSTI